MKTDLQRSISKKLIMRKAGIGLFALAPLVAACGSTPASPEPARTTETITTTATLQADGVTGYPTGFPAIVVRQRGQVDATVTFTPTADCQFIFSVCSATIASSCGTPALELESPRGRGPTLGVTGTLAPDTYYLIMSARVGGVPLCTTVPPGGLALPYTVIVTHP
jgi:hypothetical protein